MDSVLKFSLFCCLDFSLLAAFPPVGCLSASARLTCFGSSLAAVVLQ